jgi:hypothetical protein
MKKIFSLFLAFVLFGMNTACFAINYDNDFVVTTNQVPLNSNLSKSYSGYEYNISNNSKQRINVVNAQIVNGVDGNIGLGQSGNKAGSAMGVTWAIAGPVGLFTLGIGWVLGLIATPIVWVVYKEKDEKTQRESVAYTNMVPLGYINSGETVTVKSLVPIGSKSQLKLTVSDDKTKEFHSIVK